MKKISYLLFSIFLVFTNCKEKRKFQQSIEDVIDKEVTKFIKSPYSNLSGVIYLKGKSYHFHFGNLVNGKRANNETLYEIGSITKTYTGLILSQAVYDKKVNLDFDVRKYLKGEYPNLELGKDNPITLRNLITHTSGLPLYLNCDEIGLKEEDKNLCYKKNTRNLFLDNLKKVQLIDKTGKNYHYSNTGIQLVGYVLENVYSSSFTDLLNKHVFSRSGEQNTMQLIDNKTNISIGKNDKGEIMPLNNKFYKYAGGLKSSTNSVLNYIKLYLENDDPVIQQVMRRLAGNNEHGRAYAWNTYRFNKKEKMLYHNGGTFGHSTWIAIYPDIKIGVFLATNILTDDSQSDLNELSNRIIESITE